MLSAIHLIVVGFLIIYILWDWYIITRTEEEIEEGENDYSDCASLYAV